MMETHGPILIAVDGSGSMAGLKEVWAKALAIATILEAKKEKRKSQGIIFGASEKEIFAIDVDRLEDLATVSFHMGTNFAPPPSSPRRRRPRDLKERKKPWRVFVLSRLTSCGIF